MAAVLHHINRLGASIRALLDQQFWCWGQDVAERGARLAALELTRTCKPDGCPGTSQYRADLGHGRAVVLWGFGLAHLAPGLPALFVHRLSGLVRLLPPGADTDAIWCHADVPEGRPPARADLSARARLAEAFLWIATAEDRIAASPDTLLPRQRTLARWHKRAVAPADGMAARWREVADRFQPTPEQRKSA